MRNQHNNLLSTKPTLEYSCNKYCDLIGHSEVSISHGDLQVFIETYKFHRDLQVEPRAKKMHNATVA